MSNNPGNPNCHRSSRRLGRLAPDALPENEAEFLTFADHLVEHRVLLKADGTPETGHYQSGFGLRKRVWGEGRGGGGRGQPAASKIGQGAPPQPPCWGTPPHGHPTLWLAEKSGNFLPHP